ncbi:hypothetical protein F5878DRAFT_624086 [Lentinula raphanica]|uniref:Uncharacterized protein n=1 Tax=Lentinula raphanica TaxID=153919 RepID=A0AA38P5T8_9AGAR|nr:hypothetical protein F5878DRAFT_624086 [Lentinula raphanica]
MIFAVLNNATANRENLRHLRCYISRKILKFPGSFQVERHISSRFPINNPPTCSATISVTSKTPQTTYPCWSRTNPDSNFGFVSKLSFEPFHKTTSHFKLFPSRIVSLDRTRYYAVNQCDELVFPWPEPFDGLNLCHASLCMYYPISAPPSIGPSKSLFKDLSSSRCSQDTKLPTMNVQARATTEADVPEGAEIWYITSDFTAEERKFVEAGERWAALHKENWGLPAKFVILPHPKMKAREEIEGKASTILPEFRSRKSPDFGSTILDVTLRIPWQGDTSETSLSMHSFRSKETVVIGGTVPQQNWWNRLLGHWKAPRLKENTLTFDKDYDGNIVVVERMPVEEKKKNKDGYVRL